MSMKGYKVFNPDWTCRGFQYAVGQTYEMEGPVIPCERGFHFCKKAADCFNYYPFNSKNKVAEVIAHGTIEKEGDKCCTDAIEIVREISWQEVLTLVNTGKDCTGRYNSGDYNSGDYNSGDWNTGNRNTGDWNHTSFSNGCFNTAEPKIYMFNKPSDWTYQRQEAQVRRQSTVQGFRQLHCLTAMVLDCTEDEVLSGRKCHAGQSVRWYRRVPLDMAKDLWKLYGKMGFRN